ncbi:hypothetical protein EF918_35910, partial [Streptomyces sp. WAC06614]
MAPVGAHLVIGPEEPDPRLAAALSGLAPLPDAVLVLAAASDAAQVLRRDLANLVALSTGRGAARLVLAASGLAAASGPDGFRPLERLAAEARFPVIAPDGMVDIGPDGSVRIGPPGGWWLAEPGAPSRPLGPAWPPKVPGDGPGTDPPADVLPGSQAYAPRPVPGGIWFGPVPAETEALIGVRPGDLLVGVGTPHRPALTAAELLDPVRLEPVREATAAGLRPLLSAPWADPAALVGMAAALAVRLGRDVHAANGLPVR